MGDNLGVWITLAAFILAFVSAIVGITWRLQSAINKISADCTIIISTAEDRINEDWQEKTSEIENVMIDFGKSFSDFQVYVEREFVSKNSFKTVMDTNTADRKEMKTDIMGALGELRTQIGHLATAVSNLQVRIPIQ